MPSKRFNSAFFLIIGLVAGLVLPRLADRPPAYGASAFNVGGVEAPPAFGFTITPSDSTDMTQVTRSIWVGTGGDLKVRYAGNDFDTPLKNQPSGSRLPGRFSRIFSTGTTATDLVGEY